MNIKGFLLLFVDAGLEFLRDRATIFAAGLAYFAVFSIAPLLILITAIAGLFIGRSVAGDLISLQLQAVVGSDLAQFLLEIVQTFADQTISRTATVISLIVLFFSAGGIFNQLKTALNYLWGITNVRPKNTAEWVLVARHRAIPFLMVFGFGVLFGIALLIETVLLAVSTRLETFLPNLAAILPRFSALLIPALSLVTFLLIYKLLPDAESRWRDMAVGALVATLLFSVGRRLLAVFFTYSNTGSVFGAAGSIVALLIWVYFSAQILLYGAEFAWLYAERFGRPIRPNPTADYATTGGIRDDSTKPIVRENLEQKL
jgi:membrane protein